MHAIITDGSISKIINHPKRLVIGDVQYPARIFSVWTASELAAIGIIEVTFDDGNKKDENYYINTNQTYTYDADAGTVTAAYGDATDKPNAYHLTTENTTFSAPSNAVEGAFICIEINYNGSHTIAFNTIFEFAASTAPTFTSTDAKTDILVFKYSGAVWQEVGRTLNLSEA